jgi:hypothetical protein
LNTEIHLFLNLGLSDEFWRDFEKFGRIFKSWMVGLMFLFITFLGGWGVVVHMLGLSVDLMLSCMLFQPSLALVRRMLGGQEEAFIAF